MERKMSICIFVHGIWGLPTMSCVSAIFEKDLLMFKIVMPWYSLGLYLPVLEITPFEQ